VNKGKIIGALKASKSKNGIPFSECDLELVSIVAGQAAIAIENARLFDKVRVEKARLSGLMKKHLKAQEDERWRVSEELHDTVAQWLVSALYHCQSSSTLLGMSMIEEANAELDRVREVIEQSVQETRRIMHDFRPQLLGELGLVETLKHNTRAFQDETGIECDITVTGDSREVVWTHSITMYRVIVEALSNIRKHAQASMVSIKIEFAQEHICVEIVDDGAGFNLSETVQRGRLAGNMGLQTMQERAEVIGGKLLIEATPGTGTKIILIIPLDKNQNNHKKKNLLPSLAIAGESCHE
jgi:two-component system sensor histidine kinase DegS